MAFISSKMRSFLHSMSLRPNSNRGQNNNSNRIVVSNGNYNLEANNSISANKLVDKLLDYLREYYCKPIDPYDMETRITFTPRKYVSVVITSLVINGLTNFERIGDSLIAKTHESDVKFKLCSHILITDLLFDIKFCANFTQIRVKHKTLRIFVERCVIFVELTLDLRSKKSTKVTAIKVVSIDGIDCKTRGLMFPLNRTFESITTKIILNLCSDSDRYSERLMALINQFCDQFYQNIFTLNNFYDFFNLA